MKALNYTLYMDSYSKPDMDELNVPGVSGYVSDVVCVCVCVCVLTAIHTVMCMCNTLCCYITK